MAQQGQPPSEEDEFYFKWGRESLKNNIGLANDVLKQQITLSSALLGVSILFDTVIINQSLKIWVLVSFFLSLIMAYLGLMPYEAKVNLNVPDEIKKHKNKALKSKRKFLRLSTLGMLTGFALVIIEIIIKILIKFCGC